MDAVRQIRQERGLSQQALADLADVNKVTLVRIEGGKGNPNVETLEKLADALGVEIADFFPKAQAPLFPSAEENPEQRRGLVRAVANAANDWTRLVADPRLSPQEQLGIVAAARVLEGHLSVSLGTEDSHDPRRGEVSTALVRVSRAEEQYQDLADLAARLEKIFAATREEHEKAKTETTDTRT